MKEITITLGIVLGILAGYCGYFFDDPIIHTNVYMVFSALSFLLIVSGLRLHLTTKYLKIIVDATIILTFSEVLDEFFFTPTVTGWNDIVFLLLITYLSVRRYYK